MQTIRGALDLERSSRVADRGDVFDVAALRAHGAAPALLIDGTAVSYAELADRVEVRARELGSVRQVLVRQLRHDVDSVVEFLAALERGHPIALADSDRTAQTITDDLDLDRPTPPDGTIDVHPDLALLMNTSGSTGRSKLVRLSRHAVESNAVAIATYLHLTAQDRGITALPLHYCYGLSVLTSHLAVGASVVLTDTSVVDPCFWDVMHRDGVTGLAGVPFSFEMIDRVGIERLSSTELPHLRYVTQAGGRMRPDDVLRYATFGRRVGWDFFVMYGQTEATARMAFLPPNDVFAHPGAIGRAVPGSHLRIDNPTGDAGDVGEVVFRGPSVMMGYATEQADLALGHTLTELRTGDLGRVNEAGYVEITGRTSRFVKLHGRRIDLDALEAELRSRGWTAWCAGDDHGITVAVEYHHTSGADEPPVDVAALRDAVADIVAAPAQRVIAVVVDEIPRTSSGKVDDVALRRLGASTDQATDTTNAGTTTTDRDADTVASVFELVLGVDTVSTDDTFAGLGGDSFSYVEVSLRLETLLGDLPIGWHLATVGELDALARTTPVTTAPASRFAAWSTMRRLDTSVVVRAIAIALIVCTHMRLYRLPGGAHTLLAVLGYNVARFQLTPVEMPQRLRRAVATVARVAVPTSVWIGLNMLIAGGYSVGTLFLVNNYFGSPWRRDGRWEYWYFETFVQVMIVLAIVFSIGAVRRLERRAPFGFALGVLAITLLFRFDVLVWGDSYNAIFRPHTVAFFIALGWCAARATTVPRRLLFTALLAISTIGFFDQIDREVRIIVLVGALMWLPRVPLPAAIASVVGVVASASMFIFLVHWQVWPLFTSWLDRHVAFVCTMAVGVGVWWLYEQARLRLHRRRA